jgi:hypothetical protein
MGSPIVVLARADHEHAQSNEGMAEEYRGKEDDQDQENRELAVINVLGDG